MIENHYRDYGLVFEEIQRELKSVKSLVQGRVDGSSPNSFQFSQNPTSSTTSSSSPFLPRTSNPGLFKPTIPAWQRGGDQELPKDDVQIAK